MEDDTFWGWQMFPNGTADDDGASVWRVSPDGMSRRSVAWHMSDEDAVLVAAAPALLAALRVADAALDFAQAQVDSASDAKKLRGWRRDIQVAINKAEGRSE